MWRGTVGKILVNDALPEALRSDDRVLDKAGLADLLKTVALDYPDQYRDVSKRLADIGRTVATEFGGHSFGLAHLSKSKAGQKHEAALRQQITTILNDDSLTDKQRHDAIIRTTGAVQNAQMDEVYKESLAENNPLALQVLSGSRGNPMNLSSLRGSDMLYTDHRNRVLPVPILRSYAQGLTPVELWAGSYGARQGVLSTKFAVRDAGYLNKQLNQAAHRLIVTDEDDPRTDMGIRGYPTDTDDADNEGALLAADSGPYKRHTVLTPKILKHLKRLGQDRILVRSPTVGGSPEGGVYARDVGVREYGTIPGKGEMVGLTAAQALSEPVSQSLLGAKHTGGVAGQTKANVGFPAINALIQIPENMQGGAAHAQRDGLVGRIEPAPAGGQYVWIDNDRHFVPEGLTPAVKPNDRVEAGDVLSDGLPHPGQIVHHKGIGEGRRYFVDAMRKVMKASGIRANRRNIELVARGLINHVELTDEYGSHVPGDSLPYSTLEHTYEPRDGHEVTMPARAVGRYLEKPVLHYTIGTKVRPSVVKELTHFGVKDVTVHADPPPFQAEMVRGMASLQHDPDWLTQMYGSGLKDSLLNSTHRGATSNELGTSFVPGLARAADFGRVGLVRQPAPGKKPEVTDVVMDKLSFDLTIPYSRRELVPAAGGAGFLPTIDHAAAIQAARATMAKVAAVMEKTAQPRPPAGTFQSDPGSSTTTPAGQFNAPGGQSGAPKAGVQPPATPPPAAPAWTWPGQEINAKPPAQAPPAAAPPSPQQAGLPATTPGQVHPARTQALPAPPPRGFFDVHQNDEEMQDFVHGRQPQSNESQALLQYLAAQRGVPVHQITQEIRENNGRGNPEAGPGGSVGQAARLLMGIDARSAMTLTGGPNQKFAPSFNPYQQPGLPPPPDNGFGGGQYGQADQISQGGQLGQAVQGSPYENVGVPDGGGSHFGDLAGLRASVFAENPPAGPEPTNTGYQALERTTGNAIGQSVLRRAVPGLAQNIPKAVSRGIPAGPLATPINALLELADYTVGTPRWIGGKGMGNRRGWWDEDYRKSVTPDNTLLGGFEDPTGGVLGYGGAAFNAWQRPIASTAAVAGELGATTMDAARAIKHLTGYSHEGAQSGVGQVAEEKAREAKIDQQGQGAANWEGHRGSPWQAVPDTEGGAAIEQTRGSKFEKDYAKMQQETLLRQKAETARAEKETAARLGGPLPPNGTNPGTSAFTPPGPEADAAMQRWLDVVKKNQADRKRR